MHTPDIPIVPLDFNAGLDHNRYAVNAVGAWQLEGLDLHDGMRVRFEQRGELDMEGSLRLVRQDEQAYWAADVEPETLRYHITITEFIVQPHEGTLTLGIEGTKEGSSFAHFHHDGESIVLTNSTHGVDAQIHVDTWEGKQVWMAMLDCATYRTYPLDLTSDSDYTRDGERLGREAALARSGSATPADEAIEHMARDAFITMILTQPRVIRGPTLGAYEHFRVAFRQGYAQEQPIQRDEITPTSLNT